MQDVWSKEASQLCVNLDDVALKTLKFFDSAFELLRRVVSHGVDERAEVQVAVAQLPSNAKHLAF